MQRTKQENEVEDKLMHNWEEYEQAAPEFEIVVPEGCKPGHKLATTTPTGVKVTLTVPEGAVAGTKLAFALPSSEQQRPTS